MADNYTVKNSSGVVITMKSKDTGGGVQAVQSVPTDSSGNPTYGTAGTANANVVTVQGITSMTPLLAAAQATQNQIGNVGGITKSVTVTPTVTTSNAYGTNYVVGGLLTFANAFTSTGSGILQAVVVTMQHVETSGFTFFPFNANPSNSTWTDAAVANINSADVAKCRNPVFLGANSQLGTMTIASATGLGEAMAPGITSLYGILLCNATLTNNFSSASELNVTVKILQDA